MRRIDNWWFPCKTPWVLPMRCTIQECETRRALSMRTGKLKSPQSWLPWMVKSHCWDTPWAAPEGLAEMKPEMMYGSPWHE